MIPDYSQFLQTAASAHWQKIGLKRRAGIAVPLFSIRSDKSIGIGEIPDLKLLIDWCKITGMSILQMLPLNEVGDDFAPYSAISTFAIEPMYLSIENLKNAEIEKFPLQIKDLRQKFKPRKRRVNYKIKNEKLKLLWHIFKKISIDEIPELKGYITNNSYWLKDYALYKVIRENNRGRGWEKWDAKISGRDKDTIRNIEEANSQRLNFYYWLQWQLYEQLKDVKKYADGKNILLMGDLPFLVSRESADVWSHQDYFRLDLSAGAPPDMYFALGQKWGMPPYNWFNIASGGFTYLKEKLKYAENFYAMYRIDHFIGLFRIWTINISSDNEENNHGKFEPSEEYLWEQHGTGIIYIMLNATGMLPCAEDLGTVPECSYKVLHDYGIPGIDFQRYFKNPGYNFNFKSPGEYRLNSSAVISTHDSSFFMQWWRFEAGSIDEMLFELMCRKFDMDFKHFRYARKTLFDFRLRRYGRLLWNKEIVSAEMMLDILKPPYNMVNDFKYLYYDTYGEKEKFLNYLDLKLDNHEEISFKLIYKNLLRVNQTNSVFSI